MLSSVISNAVLCLACVSCIALLWRNRPYANDRPAFNAALIGFAGFALAALFGSLESAFGAFWFEAREIFSNVAAYMSLPIIALAIFSQACGRTFCKATWGRILLGSMVAFELVRRMADLNDYRLFLGCAALALILYSLLRFASKPSLAYGVASLLCISLAGTVVGTQGLYGEILRIDIYHYLLAIGLLGLGSCFVALLQRSQKPSQ